MLDGSGFTLFVFLSFCCNVGDNEGLDEEAAGQDFLWSCTQHYILAGRAIQFVHKCVSELDFVSIAEYYFFSSIFQFLFIFLSFIFFCLVRFVAFPTSQKTPTK
jgi:hypothetical protein